MPDLKLQRVTVYRATGIDSIGNPVRFYEAAEVDLPTGGVMWLVNVRDYSLRDDPVVISHPDAESVPVIRTLEQANEAVNAHEKMARLRDDEIDGAIERGE